MGLPRDTELSDGDIDLSDDEAIGSSIRLGRGLSTSDIVAVKWKDNNDAILLSNYHTYKMGSVQRWDRTVKKYVAVRKPGNIKEYNKYMGFVDLLDGTYRIRMRQNKWWWPIFSYFVSVAINKFYHRTKMAIEESRICKSLEVLRTAAKDFIFSNEIPEVYEIPSPLQFYRDYVCPSKPVIFKNAIKNWPAIELWTNTYLKEKIGSTLITASITPNGYADAVINDMFVTPEEKIYKFETFLEKLENEMTPDVYYIQKQNSNMNDEFDILLNDIETEISWASEALNKKPDAVNFWMGDKRAITSVHKDHYENLYAVIRGYKDFILLPPTDLPWIPYKEYPLGQYKQNSEGDFSIELDNTGATVPWIPIDVLNPDCEKYPKYKYTSPLHCRVSAGDLLYLPSLWYHHVRQSHQCIAVNFWYDMEFDMKYCYYKFVEDLVK
ncbi:JmjC domain-containing protein 7 [Nymphon striatum]|nr:JmjC domain-containing protein 7 [Nymphon striatum]